MLTLGCAKNEVDSDRMRTLLIQSGVEETQAFGDADVVIINTCAFLEVASAKSIELILDAIEEQASCKIEAPVVVTGCLPSRYHQELTELLPEVSAFIPCNKEDDIVQVVSKATGVPLSCEADLVHDVLRTDQGASAYVMISDGCDRYCSFCAIPYIRGHYHSRKPESILDEVEELCARGTREIVLIGQDTGIWGRDFEEKKTLAWLLGEVAKRVRPYKGWVRVLYLQPEGMTDELIATIRDTDEILNYIDMPIQHCNHEVLHRMRRSGSTKEYAELFDRLRKEIPGMVLRTTGMVGFPGETEQQFEELYSFVSDQGFDYTSVFAYSTEEGTAAAKLDGQIDADTKLEREQALRDLAETLGFAATAAHVGEVAEVIIDGVEQTDKGMEFIGHTWFQAPDCDGAVHIESGEACVGDVVTCKLVDSFCYELIGEIVD